AGPGLIEQLAYDGEGEFVNEAYIRAFDTLRHLSEEGAFNDDASAVGTVDAIRMFMAEEAAMYVNGSWDITMFRGEEVSRDFEEKIGVIPFPGLEEGRSRSITGGYT